MFSPNISVTALCIPFSKSLNSAFPSSACFTFFSTGETAKFTPDLISLNGSFIADITNLNGCVTMSTNGFIFVSTCTAVSSACDFIAFSIDSLKIFVCSSVKFIFLFDIISDAFDDISEYFLSDIDVAPELNAFFTDEDIFSESSFVILSPESSNAFIDSLTTF